MLIGHVVWTVLRNPQEIGQGTLPSERMLPAMVVDKRQVGLTFYRPTATRLALSKLNLIPSV